LLQLLPRTNTALPSLPQQSSLSTLAKERKQEESGPGMTLASWLLCHQQRDVAGDTVGNGNREQYTNSIILHLV